MTGARQKRSIEPVNVLPLVDKQRAPRLMRFIPEGAVWQHWRRMDLGVFAFQSQYAGTVMARSKGFVSKWGMSPVTINAFLKSAGLRANGSKLDGRIFAACKSYGLQTEGLNARQLVAKHADFIREKAAPFKASKQVGPSASKGRNRTYVPANVASDAFLSSYEWRRVRMLALKKYGPRCQCCGATPATGAVMNVDHIKPRKLFPQLALDVDNLQVLCHECNHGKGNWDMTDWRTSEEQFDAEAERAFKEMIGAT